MRITSGILTCAIACLSATAPAHAALISQDYLTPGDNALTLDTQTNLQWLDFDATRGLSIEQILSGAGGWITHFHYASLTDVQTLFSHADIVSSGSFQSGDNSSKIAFERLFDTDNKACAGTLACGLFPAGTRTAMSIEVGLLDNRGFANITTIDTRWSFASSNYGSALIRLAPPPPPPTPVHEPSSGLLLCLCLLRLISRRNSGVHPQRSAHCH